MLLVRPNKLKSDEGTQLLWSRWGFHPSVSRRIPEKANHRGLRTFQNLDTFCPGVFSMLLLTTQEYALCTSAVRQRYKSGTPRRYDSGTTANKRYDSGAKPQRLRQQYDSSALAVAWPKWLLKKKTKKNNNCNSARLASKAKNFDRCGRVHKKER